MTDSKYFRNVLEIMAKEHLQVDTTSRSIAIILNTMVSKIDKLHEEIEEIKNICIDFYPKYLKEKRNGSRLEKWLEDIKDE